MEFIIAVIAFVALIFVASKLTGDKHRPEAHPPQSDNQQATAEQGSRVAFDRLFSSYTQTDKLDALRMCQKRMDISHEQAMDRLIRRPTLFPEMLEYARMEEETKRLD
jgi:hypothetical protein